MVSIREVKKVESNLIQEVLHINSEGLQELYINTDSINEIIADSKQLLIVAEEDGIVVGFLHCNCVVDDNTEVISIAVKKSFQKLGIATALFEYLLGELKIRKIKKIFLEVRERNYQAIGLYNKIGFIKYNIREKYYSNSENAICMYLTLSNI